MGAVRIADHRIALKVYLKRFGFFRHALERDRGTGFALIRVPSSKAFRDLKLIDSLRIFGLKADIDRAVSID